MNRIKWSVWWCALLLLALTAMVIFAAIGEQALGVDSIVISTFASTMVVYALVFCCDVARVGVGVSSFVSFFFFWFYGLMPFVIYLSDYWLFGPISYEYRDAILLSCFDGFLFFCFFLLGYYFLKNRIDRLWVRRGVRRILNREASLPMAIPAIILQFSVLISLIFFIGVGPMFMRGSDVFTNLQSSVLALLFNVPRPAAFMVFVVYMTALRVKFRFAMLGSVLILSVGALATNFPLSLARTHILALLMILIFGLFFGSRYWRWVSLAMFIVGFAGGLFTDRFRSVSDWGDVDLIFSPIDLKGYLTAGHFDAFEMHVYANKRYEELGPMRGRQLLGSLLFFVPRVVWSEKPEPSGVVLGGGFINIMESTKNKNLSCPLPAEGRLDFGICGVIGLGVVLGIIGAFVDSLVKYFNSSICASRNFVGKLPVPALVAGSLIGSLLLVLRGSLMPAVAYLVGFLFAGCVIVFLFTKPIEGRTKS